MFTTTRSYAYNEVTNGFQPQCLAIFIQLAVANSSMSQGVQIIMGDMKKLYKDYQSLVKSLDSAFDGQVLLEEDALDTDTLLLELTIRPNDGLYKDCEIDFDIELCGYPEEVPGVTAWSTVLHPNIDFAFSAGLLEGHTFSAGLLQGQICLNVIDEWRSYEEDYRSLELLVQGLLFLFYEPNLGDAWATYAAFSTLEELEEAVNKTKYGTIARKDCEGELWSNIQFSNIYKGSITKDETDEKEETIDSHDNRDINDQSDSVQSPPMTDTTTVTLQQNKQDVELIDENCNIVSEVTDTEECTDCCIDDIDSTLAASYLVNAKADSVFIKKAERCFCIVYTQTSFLNDSQSFSSQIHRFKGLLRRTLDRLRALF